MKIGINALFLQNPTNGSGQYLLHLLHALAEVDQQNEYILLGAKPVGAGLAPALVPSKFSSTLGERGQGQEAGGRGEGGQGQALPLQISFPYQVSSVPAFAQHNENVEKLVWEQLTGPAAARKAGVDLFHVPYFAPPLYARTPIIVTIHDVIPFRLPAYRAGAKVAAYMHLVARAARNAMLVITVSQHAKQDIMDVLHIPAERIRV